jgi:hypothetical protein
MKVNSKVMVQLYRLTGHWHIQGGQFLFPRLYLVAYILIFNFKIPWNDSNKVFKITRHWRALERERERDLNVLFISSKGK